MIIHRKAGRIPIQATCFRSWSDLCALLSVGRDELTHQCVFSDVSLGAWKGHWVGREIYAQLGRSFPTELQPRIPTLETPESGGGYFGELTDNEARGDFNTLLGYAAAVDILTEMQKKGLRWIIVLAPVEPAASAGSAIEPHGFGAENLQLVQFLAQGCEEAGVSLLLVFSARPAKPPCDRWDLEWLDDAAEPRPVAAFTELGVFPGVVPPALLETTRPSPSDCLTLPDGSVVLSPLLRGHPPRPVRQCLAELALDRLGPAYEWLNGYAFADGERDDEEVGVLLGSAMDRLREGGSDVALKLLEYAKRKASSDRMQAAADGLRQHFLLRLRQFEEAARGPLPGGDSPLRLRLALFQSKGWGLTMTGRAAEAEPLLAEARGLMSAQTASRAYLYLLNISALNQLRLGRFDDALALEKTIEQKLDALDPTDWHATYINCINQARLYKKSGDLAASEAYYRKAFSTIDGLRSDSDLLYHCLCLAQIEAKNGNPKDAVICWLRAALHWLSNAIPESVAPRVVDAVMLGRRVSKDEELIEQVSAGLREHLKVAWTHANLDPKVIPGAPGAGSGERPGERPGEPPVFFSVGAHTSPQALFAVGNFGWGLFVCRDRLRPRFSGRQYLLLSHEVWRCIRALAADCDLPESCTVLTDDQFGSDLPQTLDELVGSCLRSDVKTLFFAGQRLELGGQALVPRAQVGIAPGVALCNLDGEAPVITYKRYRRRLALTSLQVMILRLVTDGITVESLAAACAPPHSFDEVLGVLRELESQRVVRIRVQATR